MANQDNDGGGPASARHKPLRASALIGLDPIAAETITLLLEIFGWSVTLAGSLQELTKGSYRLTFVKESLFLSDPTNAASKLSECLSIVLVGPPTSSAIVGARDARIFRVNVPLDIAVLESIITSAA